MAVEYRLGQVAQLLDVSVDTVRRLVDGGDLRSRRTGGGQRVVGGRDLARYLEAHAPPADAPGARQSARNQFTGVVTNVVKDKVAAQVEIRSGRHRLVSLMTREAVDALELTPGDLVTAAVKATNVVVERSGDP